MSKVVNNKNTKYGESAGRVILGLALLFIALIISGCSSKYQYPEIAKEIELPKASKGEGASYEFYASADNGYFYKRNESGKGELVYIKGVNMGLTEPLTDLNNCNTDYATYMEWLTQIAEMNANTVRVFSIMNPNFYNAFYDYNEAHKDAPLYLIQGIWFDDTLLALTDAWESDEIIITQFRNNITETIDIIHGNSRDTEYGEFSPAIYEHDISKYVVGYILGLEYDANFVNETNASHPDKAVFNGKYLQTQKGASPFEVFLATIGEDLIKYETDNYKFQIPIAFLNWQPLDTITHENEPYKDECDEISVNTENIKSNSSFAPCLFAAMDVYPYYPEFMNYEPEYLGYVDEDGNHNTYRPYLKDLLDEYSVPLLVAEYGLSTSRGICHENVYGVDQGGLTETLQGEFDAMMSRDIALSGCAGGLLFSWQDEWFKQTWNTVKYYPEQAKNRTPNLSSAEQSYGVVGFEVSNYYPDGDFSEWESVDYIQSGLKVAYDAAYMHLMIELPEDFSFENDTLYIPIGITGNGSETLSNIDDGYAASLNFSEAVDFVLKLSGESDTHIYAEGGRDVFHYTYGVLKQVFGETEAEPRKTGEGQFYSINTFTSNEKTIPSTGVTIPPQYYESGELQYGNANPDSKDYNSLADFYYKDGKVEIRIAWYLLTVANAKEQKVIGELSGEEITFESFSRIAIGMGTSGEINLYDAGFKGLHKTELTARLKKSYYIMQEVFDEIPY